MPFPRVLSDIPGRSLLFLCGLAVAAVLFLVASNASPVFAELSPTQQQLLQDTSTNVASDHAQPRSFTRSLGDSVAVAGTFDSPGARAPRVFNVGISDGLSIATSPAPPPPSGAATPTTPRPATGLQQQGTGRAEEKLGPRNPTESKGDLNNKDQKNGSVQEQPHGSISQELESILSTLKQELMGSDDSEPDDSSSNSSSGHQTVALQIPPTIYMDSLYGAYAMAVIVISVARSPRVASMKRQIAGLYAVKSEDAPRDTGTPLYARVAIIVVVIVAAVAMASAAGPVMGEAFADTNSAGAVYRSSTGTNLLASPKYREWNPSTATWGSEVELPTTGSDIRDVKIAYSPNSAQRAVVSLSADGTLNLFVCDNSCTTASSWTRVGGASFADVGSPSASTPYRYFDLAYEQSSGELMIVYDKTTTSDTNDFFYRTYANGVLSAESGFDYASDGTSDNDIRYFNLAAKPGSNELTVVLIDATQADSYALIWNGSSWGNVLQLNTNTLTTALLGESIGVAYETGSGASIVFSANGPNSAAYARWTGSWSSVSTTDPNSSSGNNVKFVTMKADPASGSNKIMICQVDDLTDLTCSQINTGTLSSWTKHDAAVDFNTSRPFDFAWDPSGSTGLIVWGTTSGSVSMNTFNGGTNSWGTAGTKSYTSTHRWIVASRNPTNSDTINSLWMSINNAPDTGAMTYDGTTLTVISANNPFTTSTGATTFEGMGIDFQKSKVIKRSIGDSLTVSANVAKKVKHTLAGAITITPTITVVKRKVASISQTITITPTIVKKVTHSIPNTLATSDSVTGTVTIIPDSNVAAMAYRSDDGVNGSSSPKYREWNPTTKSWGAQVELESAGSPIRNAWMEFSPVSTKRVIIVLSDDGTLDSYACDYACTTPSNWTVAHDIVDLWSVAPAIQIRPFDIEFEQTSGDLMLVYDKVDGGDPATDLFYRVMPDSSLTFGSESSIDDTDEGAPDNTYNFVRLDSRRTPGSNDLGLIAVSPINHRAVAWYFDGSTKTFGNLKTLTTSTSTDYDYEGIGVGFETSTGDLVAVAADGADVVYSQFSGGAWSTPATVGALNVNTVRWVRFVPNPNAGTNGIQLVVSGTSGSADKLNSAYWDGNSWTVNTGTHDSSMDSSTTRAFDFAWDNANRAFRGVLMWGDTTVSGHSVSNNISFKIFTVPNVWTGVFDLPGFQAGLIADDGASHPWVSLNEHSNPTVADAVSVLGAAIDNDSDISQLRWDGDDANAIAWTDDGATTSGNTSPDSFHVDFRRSPMLKKFPPIVLTIVDSLSARIKSKIFSDTAAITVSIDVEKGSPLDSARFAAVYRSNTGTALLNSPKYREWNPATQTWSAEVELPNTGSPVRDAQIRFSPTSSLRVVISHSDDGTLNLFKCDNSCTSASSWTLVAADFADTGTPDSAKPYRPYDMLFQTTSERLMIVYDKELTESADFYYRTFDGTTLSAETGVNLASGATADAEELRYLHLAAHPTTNEMTVGILDATDLKTYGAVWDGSAWGNVQAVSSSSLSLQNIDGDSVDVAYESQSGASLVVSGNGGNSAAYARWTGTSWTTGTANPNPDVTIEDVKFVSLKSDPLPSSNRIMACQGDDESDLSCSQFTAGVPGPWTVITSNTGTTAGRAFDFAYNPAGTTGLLVSSSGASGTLDYRKFDGTSFGAASTLAAAGTHKWILGASALSASDVVNSLFLKSNSNFDTGAIKSKAGKTSLVGDSSLTSDSFNDTYESMNIDFQKSKNVKRAYADTITITPAIKRGFGKHLSDAMAIAPALSKGVKKHISDSITVAASVAKNAQRPLAINLAVADSIKKRVTRSLANTITASDSIVKKSTKPLSVTLAVSDSVAKHKGAARSIADTITLTPSIAKKYHPSRSISETVAISPAVTKAYRALRPTAVTLTLADAITPHKKAARSVADSLSVAAAVAGKHSAKRSVADALAVSDAISRAFHASGSVSDLLSVSASVSRSVSRSIADSLTMADAISARTSRSASDSLSITDAISSRASRSFADTLSLSDSISQRASRSIAETVSVTEAIAVTARHPLADSLSIADTVSTSATRALADAIAVTDAMTIRSSRSLSDSVSVVATLSGATASKLSDTVTVADAISTGSTKNIFDTVNLNSEILQAGKRSAETNLTISDLISTRVSRTLSDSMSVTASSSMNMGRTLSDSLSVTDAVSPRVSYPMADSLSTTDAVSTRVSRSLSETLGLTDAIAKSITRSMSDSVSITDGISTTASRSVADTVVLADLVNSSVSRSLSDSLSVTAVTGLSASHPASDIVSLTDAVTTRVSRSLADSMSVADAVALTMSASRSASDALTVSDTIAPRASYPLAETVTLSDAISARVSHSLADFVAITDSVAARTSHSLTETLAVADTIRTLSGRSLSDSLSVAAAVSTSVSRSVSDSVGLTDAITSVTSRSVSDSVTLADAMTTAVSRSTADTVSIADDIATRTSRSLSDALAVTDSTSRAASHSASETLSVTDKVSTTVSRSLADTVTVTDSGMGKSTSRSLADALTVSDAAQIGPSRSAFDSLTVTDAVSTKVSRNIADSIAITAEILQEGQRSAEVGISISDSVYTAVSHSLADSVSLTSSISTGVTRSLADSITLADSTSHLVSRSLADTISATDAVSTTVSRSLADSISASDTISATAADKRQASDNLTLQDAIVVRATRSIGETLLVTDTVAAMTSHPLAEGITLTDAIGKSVSRSVSDEVTVTGTASTSTSRSIATGTVTLADSVSIAVARSIDDSLSVSFALSSYGSRPVAETLSVADTVLASLSTSRSVSDSLGVTAGTSGTLHPAVNDSLAVSDSISTNHSYSVTLSDSVAAADSATGLLAASRSAADSLAVSDSASTPASAIRQVSDALTVDGAASAGGSIRVSVSDTLAVSDSVSRTGSGPLADTVAVNATVSIGVSRSISDALLMSDSVVLPVTRTMSDSLAIADSASATLGNGVSIADSLAVSSQVTNVSVHWNRVFDEGVNLADCTPFSCNQSLHFTESLSLGDLSVSPPRMADSLAVSDSIAGSFARTRAVADRLSISPAANFMAKPAPWTAPGSPLPPISVLVVTNKTSVGVPPSVSVPGTYTYTGNVTTLVSQLKPAPHYINATVSRPDLPSMAMVLPTYSVPITPSPEIHGNDVKMSVMAAEIPAHTPVVVPISNTDSGAPGQQGFPWMKLEYTPAVNTTNFALITSIIDAPPPIAKEPKADLKPIYLDVRWVGDFPGADDPRVQTYYDNPPTFTFAVTEDWATQQNATRDDKGVPVVSLSLLNDATGNWTTVNDIDRPAAATDGGQYVYVAHLKHFSTYVITANKAATSSSVPVVTTGSSSPQPPPVPIKPQTFSASLADSLALAASPSSRAISVIEEFANEKFAANLLDSVAISSKPVAYNTFKILKGVDVSITVVDVKQKDVVPPSATAELQTEITNTGDEAEEFTLHYWYNDQTGKRVFDLSQQVKVDAHGQKTLQVAIPFTEPGTYRVTAEARSVPDDDLLESTQLTVTVPWLSVYLYVLIAVAIVIFGISAIAIALYMAKHGMVIAAAGVGMAGALVLLLGKKGKPRVKVAEKGAAGGGRQDDGGDGDDDYDLLVNVKLVNGSEGQLAPGQYTAMFDFEIVNRSKRKQEFVLAYRLVDIAGTAMPESVQEVTILKRKTQLRSAKIDLLAGAYVLHVEARTAKGEVLSSDRVSVRTF